MIPASLSLVPHMAKSLGSCQKISGIALAPFNQASRDVGSISNLGGTTLLGHLFLKKKGALSKSKKGTSLFTAKSWGHVP